jgi:hypothetical protein
MAEDVADHSSQLRQLRAVAELEPLFVRTPVTPSCCLAGSVVEPRGALLPWR